MSYYREGAGRWHGAPRGAPILPQTMAPKRGAAFWAPGSSVGRAMGTQGERGVTITAPAFGHGAASLPFPSLPGFSFRGWGFSHTRLIPNASLWPGGKGPRSQRCPSADTNQATSVLGTQTPGHPRRFSGGGTEKKNSFRVFLRSVPPPGAREGGDGEGSFCFFWVLVSENPVRGRGGFSGSRPSCPSGCPAVREPCCCLGLGSN